MTSEEGDVERGQRAKVLGLREYALGERVGDDGRVHDAVEERPDRECRGDGRISGVRDRVAREHHLDDASAPGGHHAVQTIGSYVGAPDPPPLKALARIGGAQGIEAGPRTDHQVGPEQQQRDRQGAPMKLRQVVEELPRGLGEGSDRVAYRSRDREHEPKHDAPNSEPAGLAAPAVGRKTWVAVPAPRLRAPSLAGVPLALTVCCLLAVFLISPAGAGASTPGGAGSSSVSAPGPPAPVRLDHGWQYHPDPTDGGLAAGWAQGNRGQGWLP